MSGTPARPANYNSALWRNRASPISGATTSLAILVGLGLLACWPILVHGAPDLSWDGAAHAVWAQQFASQFWQGEWYPRWFANINAGYGGPSGFFYPPLTNYASALFWPLVAARDNAGWLSSGYSLLLAFTLSGITAYLWLRSLTSARAALLGAVVYVVAPYHLAVDLYLRGASAELWVFVWLPLVLLSSEGLLRRSRWAVPIAAITFALAILSHPSTAVCFAPVAVAYVIFMSPGRERIPQTSVFAGALLLGVGLDAVYLSPAVLDQHKASVARYTSGLADYRSNWVLPWRGEISSGAHYLLARFAGATATLPIGVAGYVFILLVTLSTMLAIALLFLLARRAGADGRIRRIAAFYAVVALVAFFFMTRASALLWSLAGFLKYLAIPFAPERHPCTLPRRARSFGRPLSATTPYPCGYVAARVSGCGMAGRRRLVADPRLFGLGRRSREIQLALGCETTGAFRHDASARQ